jgi:hypothetical protein
MSGGRARQTSVAAIDAADMTIVGGLWRRDGRSMTLQAPASVDGLAQLALDARQPGELQLSSILALSDLEVATFDPLWKMLVVSTPSRTTPQ